MINEEEVVVDAMLDEAEVMNRNFKDHNEALRMNKILDAFRGEIDSLDEEDLDGCIDSLEGVDEKTPIIHGKILIVRKRKEQLQTVEHWRNATEENAKFIATLLVRSFRIESGQFGKILAKQLEDALNHQGNTHEVGKRFFALVEEACERNKITLDRVKEKTKES
jgi:hypothetical protein